MCIRARPGSSEAYCGEISLGRTSVSVWLVPPATGGGGEAGAAVGALGDAAGAFAIRGGLGTGGATVTRGGTAVGEVVDEGACVPLGAEAK